MGRGDIMLRVYDKVLELRKSPAKQVAFAEIWGVESYDEQPVTRVEFQLRRPVLREFETESGSGVKTLLDLELSLNSLWEYLTFAWCRLADQAVDRKNRHQDTAVISSFWRHIQIVAWSGVVRLRRMKQYALKDVVRLAKQMAGLGMTISAILGQYPDDVDGILAKSSDVLGWAIREKAKDSKEFVKLMCTKILQSYGPSLELAPF